MDKEKILNDTKKHIKKVLVSIEKSNKEMHASLLKSKEAFKNMSSSDRVIEERLIAYFSKRISEILILKSSPYFVRCDVVWEDENEVKTLYFSKFSFSEELIYSWVSKASSIRFENIGKVEYLRPDGKIQKAKLVRKDQCMIVDGKIKFLSSESVEYSRQLIYQEHFSNRKTGFVLPEIVAEMEKTQDKVIRAHYKGSFLISGPAGSGKTTLALHRIAYLATSPDLLGKFNTKDMIVFVQDDNTKDYFAHLLPELGINDVLITTFSSWVIKVLNLTEKYVFRYGTCEIEKDLYEFAKIKALRKYKKNDFKGSKYAFLEKVYHDFLSEEQIKIFKKQKNEHVFDHIDLTLLLMKLKYEKGHIGAIKEYWHELQNGNFVKKRKFVPFNYSLIAIDEFQNYLPEQLNLFKSCANTKNQSVIYIGDMRQQIRFGTISNWHEIDEDLHEERRVIMQKVYRNTKNILRYISKIGYEVEIPNKIKEGDSVKEYVLSGIEEEILYIKNNFKSGNYQSIGIIAKNFDYLVKFKDEFKDVKKIKIMTMVQSQGVEFDKVFIVGISEETFLTNFLIEVEEKFKKDKFKINKDLLYVALTRATYELHILGTKKLSEICI